MICQNCNDRQATVHFTRIIDGKQMTTNLCGVCAAEMGLTPGAEFSFPGFFEIPDIFANLFRRRTSDRMYESFSETSRQVIHLASEEARRLNHDMLGPEHLLLGLIKEQGIAARILESLGAKASELFTEIEALLGHGETPPKQISLSPRSKRALEIAYRTASELRSGYVGPEHILLGLIREQENIAAQVLSKKGVTLEKALKELRHQIEAAHAEELTAGPEAVEEPSEDEGPDTGAEEGGIPGAGYGGVFPGGFRPEQIFGGTVGAPPRPPKAALAAFSRNLTQMAQNNQLDPVIGRDKEIERVIRILSRRTKNNPALLGDPGVGKTAIVEGLAQRIAKGDVPEVLKGKQLLAIDLAGMIAGTKYRGEFEQRIKKVIDQVMKASRKYILFIDELHTLVGAGAAEGAMDAANILKPALAKGDLQIVGATTVDEYRKHIEKDAALERRFQPVMVPEPTVEMSMEILKGIRDKYEAHHRVKISDAVITACCQLADRYISDRFLPDKAIDLMDESAAKVRLRLISAPQELRSVQKEIEKLRGEIQAAATEQKFEKAAELKTRLAKAEENAKTLEDNWKKESALKTAEVTEDDVAETAADWTGIPVTKLTEAESQKLLKMEETLHQSIVGQDEAVVAVSQAIRRGRAGLKPATQPVGSFIFAGPTGVGKTELAKRLAEFLFGTQEALIRVDMSEYMEKHTVSRLIGAPPGYVGYDEGGMLTEAVRRKPYSVILIDEIEKAHPDVFNILLQVLDDGRLTDTRGRTVDFKNTVIIMTTNLGAREGGSGALGFAARAEKDFDYDALRRRIQDEIHHNFRPEFLNRIDEIIVFHPLTEEQIRAIVDILLKGLIAGLKERGITIDVSNGAKDLLAKEGYSETFGARPLRRTIQSLVENPLSNDILAGKFEAGDTIAVDAENGKIIFPKK